MDTAKSIVDLAQKGMTVGLQEMNMQLREEALELQAENLKLKTENIDLKKKEELREKVKPKRKVYYREGDEVPLCPYCYEKNQSLFHIMFRYELDGSGELYQCIECKSVYETYGQDDFTFGGRD